MDTAFETEGDVGAHLLTPLFREVLGYPASGLHWSKPVRITLGRETKTKQADLVVYHDRSPVITVEAKRPTEPIQTGLGQVDSYAFALQTPYSVITNGKHFVLRGYYSFNSRINVIDDTVQALAHANWDKLKSLVSFENVLSSIREPANSLPAPDEEKIRDYRRFFRRIHNAIRDRDRLDPAAAFDELSKLLFLKAAEDEWQQQKGRTKPVLTPEMIEEWEAVGQASEFVNQWFQSATAELFPGVFGDHPRIELSAEALKEVLAMMRLFHVKNGDVDVKGRAFEEFLPSQLRGKGLGQYFTPRPIVNFMAEMAGVSIRDTVVDFSCGSGGFLIKAFELMKGKVEQLPDGTLRRMALSRGRMLEDIKSHQIYGIDAEPRAARTAKMNMLMWGDGKRVVRGNALDTADFGGNPYGPKEYQEDEIDSGCTLILANPPFGSKEKDQRILKNYLLGSKLRSKASEKTEILFLEKGVKLLRPEGKMLIVLPQSILSGVSHAPVRDFLHSEAEIRAIVTWPTHAFVQSGVPTVNTCVLYLQKFTKEKKLLYDKKAASLSVDNIRSLLRRDPDFDYPIFMGTAEFIGYEPSGRMIIEVGEETDLDLLLKDFADQSEMAHPDVDLFEFASRHYGEKSFRRKEQTVRGTVRGLKTSFVLPFHETAERLDPPYYIFGYQAGKILESLTPLADAVQASGERFFPETEDQLDAEYPILSVSSDGNVRFSHYLRGEQFTQDYKRVRHKDIVYNPSRINIGSIGVVPKELHGSYVSAEYVTFRSSGLEPEFLVDLLRSPFYKMYIDVVSTGTIRDRLYYRDLQTIRVPHVDPDRQRAIRQKASDIDGELHRSANEIAAKKVELANELREVIDPPGRNDPEREATFRLLVEEWRRETGMHSSITKKVQHPAYQKIIRMGGKVVPLILRELRDRPGYWFEALKAITGQTPVQAADRADPKRAREAWLKWGKEKGLVD
ncbi:MAG TPA: N-6 DNA methylase [Gemmataceae bacterium]|nr:N-6 DNA methylase [Gemmataceae bacterium]